MPSNCFNRLSFLHYSWNLSFFPLLREKNHLTFLLFFNSFFLPLILTLFPILSILFHLSAYLSLFVFPCFLFFTPFFSLSSSFASLSLSLSLSLSHFFLSFLNSFTLPNLSIFVFFTIWIFFAIDRRLEMLVAGKQ